MTVRVNPRFNVETFWRLRYQGWKELEKLTEHDVSMLIVEQHIWSKEPPVLSSLLLAITCIFTILNVY